jgi:CheY-like chemotaxis protein
MNLISNAVKFTEHGFVKFKVDYQSPELIMEIVDSGTGISDEQQQRIFQAFEQADLSTTRQFGGTGLGLYICRRLAELLDARLTLQSQLGKGSCFVLRLPISLTTAEQQAALVKSTVQPIDFSGKTILIVDDVAELRRLFQSMLTNSKASIFQASDGDEALEVISLQTVDLVLLDMHMPVRDGMSTLKTMRLLGYNQPVIALTADVLPEKHQEILHAGGQLVLTKPVSQMALLEAIQLTLTVEINPIDINSADSKQMSKVDSYQETQQSFVLQANPFDELQLSFIESLAEQIEELQNAEPVPLKLLLHKLKGTAACLELNKLSELASQAELALKNEEDTSLVLTELVAEINHLLSQLPAEVN